MARTKQTGSLPSEAAGASVTVGQTVNMNYSVVEPIKFSEYRVGSKKVLLPTRITGTENEATMNIIYHTAQAKLQNEASSVAAHHRMMALASVLIIYFCMIPTYILREYASERCQISST